MMQFLGTSELKADFLESNNFKQLLEREINICDSGNNTTLMYLCYHNSHLLNHKAFATMFKL